MTTNVTRFVDFRALKAAVTMEQVLEHYGLLANFQRGHDSLTGPCPIHGGSNPTQFRISISNNCWHCFSDCHGGGNVLDFVARMEKVEPVEAANRLIDWFQLDRAGLNGSRAPQPRKRRSRQEAQPASTENAPPATPKEAAEAAPAPVAAAAADTKPENAKGNSPLGFRLELDSTHPYLAERGLTPETIVEFGLGHCSRGVMAGRIAIPIENVKGELVGYAGRWPGVPPEERPKYRLPDGFKRASEIFRLASALREPAEQPLVIVEGFFDATHLWQLGVRKTVALMGSSLSLAQEALLAKHLNLGSHVVVAFDEDDAGRIGRDWVLQRLARIAYVRVLAFPKEDMQPEQLTLEDVQRLALV